jgi:hypothetical protein
VTVERWTAGLWDQKDDVSVSVGVGIVLDKGEEQKQHSPSMRLILDLGLANAGYVASHVHVAQWRTQVLDRMSRVGYAGLVAYTLEEPEERR